MANRAGTMNVGGVTVVGTASITAADDLLTITGHGLADGDLVMVDTLSGGGAELREGSKYVVRSPTADTFQLSTPSGAELWDFDTDGSARVLAAVPSYAAVDLRRIDAIALHPGSADRLGAREGVRPHSSAPVTVSGTTWTANEGVAVVYPAETTTSGPYVVTYDQTAASLDPADGSNPRLDGVDLQVEDDDEDGSGQRRVRIVYVPGTPASSPSAPAVTVNSLRLATVLVPAGGTPDPTVDSLAQYALGAGVLPVRDDAERPTAGLYDMMLVGRQDTGQVEARHDGSWQVVATAGGQQFLGEEVFSTSGSFDIGDYPGAQSVVAQVQGAGGGGGGCSAAAAGGASVGAGGAGGAYRRGRIPAASLASSEPVTIGAAGTGGPGGGTAGTSGGTSSFGSHIVSNGGGAGESDGTDGPGSPTVRIGGSAEDGGSGGDITIPGAAGQNGIKGDGIVTQQGNGGSSFFSGGGRASATNAGGDGPDAPGSGAGGSGGFDYPGGSERSGGDGGAGLVILEVWG